MQRRLGQQERAQLLEALYDLHNRCALAKLRVEPYGDLYDQFDDLLRQVNLTSDMLRDLKPWPPKLARGAS